VSGYFVATGANAIVERIASFDEIDTSESTTSTSYTDLTTPGPAVTATTGARALYIVTARQGNDTSNAATWCAAAVTGASSIAASDSRALLTDGITGANEMRMSMAHLESNLNSGSNTFTMKYKVTSGEGTWLRRHLIVLPY
jgi:hypothetical protein